MSVGPPIGTFAEFWPHSLREHRQPGTRTLHLVGTTLSLLLLVAAVVSGRSLLLLGALVAGYGFAWVGPLWSLAADWRMWALALSGRLAPELRRAGV